VRLPAIRFADPHVRRALVIAANLAALAVLAAVLAHWGWRWLGPAPYVAAPPPMPDAAATFAVSPPFGAPGAATPVPSVAPAPAADGRLMGVFAERDGGGHALFRMPDGSARLVAAGAALSQEATLVAVYPDRVTVRDARGERAIALRAASDAQRGTSGKPAPQRIANAACGVPASYKGPVVRINAELVQGLMAQPESLRRIADARDGALVVREASGFAALLGMKEGDRVTQANGIALRAPEDVIVAVLRPLAASQTVRVVGSRGAEPREVYIVNAGACS
jgi:hypothetical protein